MVEVLYSLECMVVRLICFPVTFAFGVCNEHCSVCVCVCVQMREPTALLLQLVFHTHTRRSIVCICVFAFLRFFCFAFCVKEYIPTGPSV